MSSKKILPTLLIGIAFALPNGLSAQDVYQDNIVVVLDASGSMDEAMAGGQKKMAVATW